VFAFICAGQFTAQLIHTTSQTGGSANDGARDGQLCFMSHCGWYQMIATLDSFRDTLEDLGGGLGVTDPVSGSVVLALK
jgi:hypothetical protein